MVTDIDIIYALSMTFNLITSYLELLFFLIIVYTNSYSLYEYLVKLSTIKEKRLIIDILAL